ncbi:MAG: CPXCG motif-containing cysteine-rich protein [Woeseiaceae bacterium]
MNRELEDQLIECPYCGESIDILIDRSEPEQSYIEDCQVCCRPINIQFSIGPDGEVLLSTTTDNE